MSRRCFSAALLVASIGLAPGAQAQATREGIERDDAPDVLAPADPPEVVTYSMQELWRRGEDDDEIVFGAVVQLVADAEGNVYLLDAQTSPVLVFSPVGKHLRTMGCRGEARPCSRRRGATRAR
jgi:hypothetical protein